MNHLHRLHVLFVSTLGMIVAGIGILGLAEVARGQASYEELHAFVLAVYPYAGLIQDSAGNLYGTTNGDGVSSLGTVYKLEPSGAFTVLHAFDDYSDGASPLAGLIQDSAGNLYGTTSGGGEFGAGTVYKLEPSGTFAVLHSFNYSDGDYPYAGLIQDSAGTLYGTTQIGGAPSCSKSYK